ncbi:MAG TPA: AsmA family protein, partial [Geobacteraceae bacterium]|nr:AsmA family protein [Geobacteraceae bacterium]
MTIKRKILLSLCAIIVLSIATGVVAIFNKLHHLDTYKNDIVAAAQKALGRRLTYKSGDFSLKYGPTFTFTGVTVMEKDGTSIFISSDQLAFKVAFWPLLKKKLVLKEVRLDRPYIRLHRDRNGKFNVSDILEGKREEVPLRIRRVRMGNGLVTLTDQSISKQGVTTTLENMDLFINRTRRGKNTVFKLSARITEKGRKSTLSINGKAILSPKGKPLRDSHLDVRISANKLDAGHYWDYYSRYVPFQKILGLVDIDSTFNGKLSEFSSKGTVKLRGLYFNYPEVFHSRLTPKEVLIKYDMDLTPKDLAVKHLLLNVDALAVKGSCFLKDIHSGDLFLSAKATTGPFRLEEFSKYIPYGIIAKDASEFIEKHIKGGTYRLQEGRLEGRISQIAHMERGTNYNVLSIGGTVDRGLVSFGGGTPSFNSIRGNLALRGKDFILAGMEGSFGGSPFKLEGRITGYPLNVPSGYPFTMTMTPEPAEVSWLLGPKHASKFAFAGQSVLHLSGNGHSSNYALNGNWDLTGAAYKYADIIHKPQGKTNNLSVKGSINNAEVEIAGLNYVLNSLSLNAAGSYRFAEDPQLIFTVDTNQFQIQDVASMVPRLERYLPKGKVKAAFQGKWKPAESESIALNGHALLSDVSLKAIESMKPLEDVTGNIRFTGDSLQTSMLSARLGNTTLHATGSLTGRKNP